jgi:hypothetical protein
LGAIGRVCEAFFYGVLTLPRSIPAGAEVVI